MEESTRWPLSGTWFSSALLFAVGAGGALRRSLLVILLCLELMLNAGNLGAAGVLAPARQPGRSGVRARRDGGGGL